MLLDYSAFGVRTLLGLVEIFLGFQMLKCLARGIGFSSVDAPQRQGTELVNEIIGLFKRKGKVEEKVDALSKFESGLVRDINKHEGHIIKKLKTISNYLVKLVNYEKRYTERKKDINRLIKKIVKISMDVFEELTKAFEDATKAMKIISKELPREQNIQTENKAIAKIEGTIEKDPEAQKNIKYYAMHENLQKFGKKAKQIISRWGLIQQIEISELHDLQTELEEIRKEESLIADFVKQLKVYQKTPANVRTYDLRDEFNSIIKQAQRMVGFQKQIKALEARKQKMAKGLDKLEPARVK